MFQVLPRLNATVRRKSRRAIGEQLNIITQYQNRVLDRKPLAYFGFCVDENRFSVSVLELYYC
jgi:hypothetical protein